MYQLYNINDDSSALTAASKELANHERESTGMEYPAGTPRNEIITEMMHRVGSIQDSHKEENQLGTFNEPDSEGTDSDDSRRRYHDQTSNKALADFYRQSAFPPMKHNNDSDDTPSSGQSATAGPSGPARPAAATDPDPGAASPRDPAHGRYQCEFVNHTGCRARFHICEEWWEHALAHFPAGPPSFVHCPFDNCGGEFAMQGSTQKAGDGGLSEREVQYRDGYLRHVARKHLARNEAFSEEGTAGAFELADILRGRGKEYAGQSSGDSVV